MLNYAIYPTMQQACISIGIEPKEERRRFTRTDVSGCGKHGANDGAIMYFGDGAGGICFNWRTGAKALFIYGYQEGKRLSRAELNAIKRKVENVRKMQARAQAIRNKAVATLSAQIIESAHASADHPYLKRKQVLLDGAPSLEISRNEAQRCIDVANIPQDDNEQQRLGRMGQRLLIVPLGDDDGNVKTLQLIDEDGRKTYLKGGAKRGLIWRPEGLEVRSNDITAVGLAEGVATALSVTALYGVPCCAGMDANNLEGGMLALRRCYPMARITIFADRDPSGIGREKAINASRFDERTDVYVCPALTPEQLETFKQRTGASKATDFNDLMVAIKEED